jgi:hypothetical protein
LTAERRQTVNYEEIRRTKEKFDAYVGSYIKTHPLESYREIGLAVGIPEWKVQAIARNQGIRRLGGHPGIRLCPERPETGKEGVN